MAAAEIIPAHALRREWPNLQVSKEVVPWQAITAGEHWTRDGEENHTHTLDPPYPLPHFFPLSARRSLPYAGLSPRHSFTRLAPLAWCYRFQGGKSAESTALFTSRIGPPIMTPALTTASRDSRPAIIRDQFVAIIGAYKVGSP